MKVAVQAVPADGQSPFVDAWTELFMPLSRDDVSAVRVPTRLTLKYALVGCCQLRAAFAGMLAATVSVALNRKRLTVTGGLL
jgi:hypothetical protein